MASKKEASELRTLDERVMVLPLAHLDDLGLVPAATRLGFVRTLSATFLRLSHVIIDAS